jgi:hypothetical protein
MYLPVRLWTALYILSRLEQAEHVLTLTRATTSSRSHLLAAAGVLGDGLLIAEDAVWRLLVRNSSTSSSRVSPRR